MASTVSNDKNDSEYQEFIDSPKLIKRKVTELAELIRKYSGRVVVYTGAGISTGAGIPDFRSGLNSATGMPAGKWCQDATSTQWTAQEKAEEEKRRAVTTSCLNAIPTKSHMALVALQQAGILKGLISQNCDGLHRRSGFPAEHLAELHGNTNLEYCAWCGKEYFRDFRASTGRHTRGKDLKSKLWSTHEKLDLINPRRGNHYTGRRCVVPGCKGYLFDSTIDFGDNLPELHIERGYKLAREAGLCIVLGSRCSVSPACDMPISVGKSKRPLVVVNLQKTAADDHACLRIGSKIDEVMVPLMEELGIRIPEFSLKRRIRLTRNEGLNFEVNAVESDGSPTDLLWNVQARFPIKSGAVPTDAPLVPIELVMNQDAISKKTSLPQPGDRAVVEDWPWANADRPGMANVLMTSGSTKNNSYTVSADICDSVDDFKVVGSELVVNGGQCHGPTLTHLVPAPAQVTGPCHRLTLMFRAHYAEASVTLPPPDQSTSTLYLLEYFPGRGTWGGTSVLEAVKPDSSVDMQDDKKAEPPPPLFLHIEAKESTNEAGKYRCFHNLSVSTDQATTVEPEHLAGVCYKMPGQGFRAAEHLVMEPPFKLSLGPCWGRPHVTIDVTTKDGQTYKAVFEANLPSKSAVVPLLQPAPVKADD